MSGKKNPKYIYSNYWDFLVIRPCRNENVEGNCVRKERKSHVMIIFAKILYVYWQ